MACVLALSTHVDVCTRAPRLYPPLLLAYNATVVGGHNLGPNLDGGGAGSCVG